ncbi:MAG: VTT domain-containing protein [Nitrosomonadales bacterium]|nr:VTT domain-containing protein [Nitrosomonadales bacterium]
MHRFLPALVQRQGGATVSIEVNHRPRVCGRSNSMTLLVRLFPVGNNLATNLAAGAIGVHASRFFAGSLLGYVPQTAIFALAGSGVGVDPALRIGLSVTLFVLSSVFGAWCYRRHRRARAERYDYRARYSSPGTD